MMTTARRDLPVTQTINGERIVLLGWSRAILLQLAHPLVAAAVAEHSSFRSGQFAPLRRLGHTVRAMLAITFGDSVSRSAAIHAIQSIHRRVHGALTTSVGPWPIGTPYSAEDPALLLWVHLTLVQSMVITYESIVSPLTDAQRDAYCAETAGTAVELGVDAAAVPCRWSELEDGLQRSYASGEICVGAEARHLAATILSPPLGWWAWPGLALNRIITLGLLPSDVRSQYGLEWDEAHDRSFRRCCGALARGRKAAPAALALWRDYRRLVKHDVVAAPAGAMNGPRGEPRGRILP
ncbi:MAG: oxygenase MpaB family protein [Vicinamibacterales bacterium]